MNKIQEILNGMGLTPAKAAKLYGVPYHNLFKQCKGERNVGPRCAILYEQVLGIPRWELRPDLWPAPTENNASASTEEA